MDEVENRKDEEDWRKSFSRELYRLSPESFKTSYQKDDYLGCGSYGHVRRCYHEVYDTVVAKCYNLAGQMKQQNSTLKNVSREANILSRLYHDNIVKVLGITNWGDCIAIIMEYVDGGSLQDLLFSDKIQDISLDLKLCIVRQLSCGLDYLHNYAENTVICHGDLKPSNVLFTKGFVVKLADLGSANVHNASGDRGGSVLFDSVQVKESGQYTLSHVAPEFLKETKGPRFPSMDMYSLSMIMYEMLTRKPVYEGANETPLYLNLLDGKLRPDLGVINQLKERYPLNKGIFEFLKQTMIRCWDVEPERRPTSTTVFQEASVKMKSCNGLKIHREWKKLSKILRNKTKKFPPSHDCVDLSQFNNHFIETKSPEEEGGVFEAPTTSTPKQQQFNIPTPFSRHTTSLTQDEKVRSLNASPHSKSFSSFSYSPNDPTTTTDPELYLQMLTTSCDNIKEMAGKETDSKTLTKQCNTLLKRMQAKLPTRNQYPLTMSCLEIATALKQRSMFSLAIDFVKASMSLHKLLNIGSSERQYWSERMSATCRNLADVMVKTFKDDDVRDRIMPIFLEVLDQVKNSNIECMAKISSCHNILKHIMHVCNAIHDYSHADDAAKICLDMLRAAKSSPTRTNLCSTGQLCDYIGDIYVKLKQNSQAQDLYNEAISHLHASRKWTNNAMTKEQYIVSVQMKLSDMQIVDEADEVFV